jgi:predicted DNA-binding transcriptional regulator AlpA
LREELGDRHIASKALHALKAVAADIRPDGRWLPVNIECPGFAVLADGSLPRRCARQSSIGGCAMTTGMMGDDDGLLTEQDVAGALEVSLSTLRRWHREGTGPPCLEIGRQVRYRRAAVERWSTGSSQAGSPDENR